AAAPLRHQLHVHQFDARRRVEEGGHHERAIGNLRRKPGRLFRPRKMTGRLRERFLAFAHELRLPVTAALLVTGCVRLLLSVRASCAELKCDDFGRFWYATTGWWESGSSLYAVNPASIGSGGMAYANLNLPHTHVLFLPFVFLPRDLAAAVWLLVVGACIVATLMLIARESGWQPTLLWTTVFV